MPFLTASLRRLWLNALLPGLLLGAPLLATAREETAEVPAVVARYEMMLERAPEEGVAFNRVYQHFFSGPGLAALEARWAEKSAAEPDEAVWPLLQGLLAERRGDLEAARGFYAEAEERDPSRYRTALARAELAAHKGDHAVAAAAYAAALERGVPLMQRAELYAELARAHERAGDREAALAAWRSLAAEAGEDPFALEEAAAALAQAGAHDDAFALYAQLAEMPGHDPFQRVQARMRMAELRERQGETEAAIALYGKALSRADPESWLYREINAAIEALFRREDDWNGLIAYYESHLERHPRDLNAALRLSEALVAIDRFEDGLAWLERVIGWAPGREDLRFRRARWLLERERFGPAQEALRELVAAEPENWTYRETLGEALWREFLYLDEREVAEATARRDEAITVWRELVDPLEPDTMPWMRLGDLFRRYGVVGAALAAYDEAILREPENFDLRERAALYLFSLDQEERAWALFQDERVLRGNASAHLRFGQFQHRYGRTEGALATVESGRELAPDDFNLAQLQWDLLTALQRYDEAEALFPELRTLAPNAYFLDDVEARYVRLLRMSGRVDAVQTRLAARLGRTASPLSEAELRLLARIRVEDGSVAAAQETFAVGRERFPESISLGLLEANFAKRYLEAEEQVAAWLRMRGLDPRREADWLREAALAWKSINAWDEALRLAEEALGSYPSDPRLHLLYADLCYARGNDVAGNQALRDAIRLASNTHELSLRLARELSRQGQTDEAADVYEEAFYEADNENQRQALLTPLVELHLTMGSYDSFVSRFQRRLRQMLPRHEYALYLTTVYQEAQDMTRAREALSAAITFRQDEPRLVRQLINLARNENNTSEWVRGARMLVRMQPSAENEIELALALFAANEWEEGLAKIEEHLQIVLARPQGWREVMDAIRQEEAREQFHDILFAASRDQQLGWQSALDLAEFFLAEGRIDQAERLLWQILEIEAELVRPGTMAPVADPAAANLSPLERQVRLGNQAQTTFSELLAARFNSHGQRATLPSAGAVDLLEGQVAALIYLSGIASLEQDADGFVAELGERFAALQTPWPARIISYFQIKARPQLMDEIELALDAGHYDPELFRFCHEVLLNTVYWNNGAVVRDDGPRLLELADRLAGEILRREPREAGAFLISTVELLRGHNEPQVAARFLQSHAARVDEDNIGLRLAQGHLALEQRNIALANEHLAAAFALMGPRSRRSEVEIADQAMRAYARQLHQHGRLPDSSYEVLAAYLVLRFGHEQPQTANPTGVAQRFSQLQAAVNRYAQFPVHFPNEAFPGDLIPFLRETAQLFAGSRTPEPFFRILEERAEVAGVEEAEALALARIYLLWMTGDTTGAIARTRDRLERAPSDDLRFILGELLIEERAFREAREIYRSVEAERGPLFAAAQMKILLTSRALEENELAREAAEALVAMNLPLTPAFNLQQHLRDLGMTTPETRPTPTRTVRQTTRRSLNELLRDLGQLAVGNQAEEVDRLARLALTQSLQTRQSANATSIRRDIFQHLARVDRLEPYLRELEQRLASAPQALRELQLLAEGWDFHESQDPQYRTGESPSRALDYFRRLYEARPEEEEYFLAYANELSGQKQYDALADLYLASLQRDFFYTLRYQQQVAQAFSAAQRVDDLVAMIARADYPTTAVQRMNQRTATAASQLMNIGIALEQLGHGDAAIAVWRQALQLAPAYSSLEIRRRLVQALQASGETEEVADILVDFFLPPTPEVPTDDLWLGRRFDRQPPEWLRVTNRRGDRQVIAGLQLLEVGQKVGSLAPLRAAAVERMNREDEVVRLDAELVALLIDFVQGSPLAPARIHGFLEEIADREETYFRVYASTLTRNLAPLLIDHLEGVAASRQTRVELLRRLRDEADRQVHDYRLRAEVRFELIEEAKQMGQLARARAEARSLQNVLWDHALRNASNFNAEWSVALLHHYLDLEMEEAAVNFLTAVERSPSFREDRSFQQAVDQVRVRLHELREETRNAVNL